MNLNITFDVGEYERQAISLHYGRDQIASYDDVRRHILDTVRNELDDLCYTLQTTQEAAECGELPRF